MNIDNELISVCIPTYNVENYIVQCIDSILAQTYPNLEIIICDDASTDNTLKILYNKYNHLNNVTILRNPTNQGVAYTRNKILSHSNGAYIALMDSDDICMPNRLRIQFDALNTGEFDFCTTDAYLINMDNSKIIGYWKTPTSVEVLKDLLCVKIPFPQPSVMVRRTFFEKYSYDEKEMSEDYKLWTEAVSDIKFISISKPLLKVRINPTSVSKLKTEPLFESAHKIRVQWIIKNYFNLTNIQINALQASFSHNNSRNYDSLKCTKEILYKIYLKNKRLEVSEQFQDQIFWLCLKHAHLSYKVPFLFFSSFLTFKNNIKIKKIIIISLLSIFKIKYESNTYKKIKKILRK